MYSHEHFMFVLFFQYFIMYFCRYCFYYIFLVFNLQFRNTIRITATYFGRLGQIEIRARMYSWQRQASSRTTYRTE
jgi:hypothetical protein